jgi:hypothetical protein
VDLQPYPIIEELKQAVQRTRTPQEEWAVVQHFLERPDVPVEAIQWWVFLHLVGYTSTRVWAGYSLY